MIALETYPPAFGQFSASPFCTKAAILLTSSGMEWQRQDTHDPRKMPFGKLPVIRVGDEVIADSDRIRTYLEAKGADFDTGLSQIDIATARAFIRMAEEHIYFHVVMDRWDDNAVWPAIRNTYFAQIPRGLRGFVTAGIRRQVRRGLHAQGLGRFTPDQRLARLEPDLNAISTRLWQNRFLFGDRPTAADASVGPMLSAAAATPGQTLLTERIRGDAALTGYITRTDALLD